MDGLKVSRVTAPAGARPWGAGPAGGQAARRLDIRDGLALSGGASGGASPLSAAGPPGASPVPLLQEIERELASAEGLYACQLAAFAAVVASTADDPQATAMLAQAWRQPNASHGASRLHALFFSADPATGTNMPTLAHLYYTAMVDGEDGAELLASHPNAIYADGAHSGGDVLAAIVREVYSPVGVLQGDKQTCGAAAAQMILAREGPAEYVRLVTGLAFEGEATLQSGVTIRREPDWDADPADRRSVTGQLVQAALMEVANGADEYQAATDDSFGPGGWGPPRKGLSSIEMERLLHLVTNQPVRSIQVRDWQPHRGGWVPRPGAHLAQAMAKIEEMTAKGWAVPVLVSVQPNQSFGHYQLVTRVEGETVYSLNPWGREEAMALGEFRDRLITPFFQ